MSERIRPAAPFFARTTFKIVLLAFYLPLLVMIFSSLIEYKDDDWFFTLKWYQELLIDYLLIEALGRSLFVALISSAIATVIGVLGALVIYRIPFWGRKIILLFSKISLTMPELVFALSLLSWFAVFKINLGLHTVIAAHVTFCLSFVILTIGARIQTLSSKYEETARDLGASELIVLTRITLPLLKPAIWAGALLSFLLSFDDFLITFFTSGSGSDTLPVKLYSQMKFGLTPKLHALAVVMLLISMALIFFIFQIKGIRELLTGEKST